MKTPPFDQASHTDTLSGRGCCTGWVVLVVPGPLGASASDHGDGIAIRATVPSQSRTGSPGANTGHVSSPRKNQQTPPKKLFWSSRRGPAPGALGVPLLVCPALVLSYKSATYSFTAPRGLFIVCGSALWLITSSLLRRDRNVYPIKAPPP